MPVAVVQETAVCCKCGKPAQKSLFTYNGIGLCGDCLIEHYKDINKLNVINSYSYKPAPKFQTRTGCVTGDARGVKTPTKRFFGFELELEHTAESDLPDGCRVVDNNIPLIISLTSGGNVYCKSDSSLGSNGVEIVSHPCELNAIGKTIHKGGTIAFLNMLKSLGLSATGRCGLHIHVSKDSFGTALNGVASDVRVDGALIKLNYMIANHTEIFKKLSFRAAGNSFSYAKLPQKLPKTLDYVISRGSFIRGERHRAINPTENTIEFRFFGATLDPIKFIGAFNLIDTLADFTAQTVFNGCSWDNYMSYLKARHDSTAHKVLTYINHVGIKGA